MAKLTKKEAERQQLPKNRYWQNELDSLGIEPKRKTELNDVEELEKLADIIKQAMFQDYKVAYSEEGDTHKEEAQSTVTVGSGRGFKSHPVHFYQSSKLRYYFKFIFDEGRTKSPSNNFILALIFWLRQSSFGFLWR